ncbi:MAG: succinate dehydrogenase, cytochrome b556 subunit [Dokdonella sp.]|uniref:succinate dehydrogenase, cytochrome b556 subunit n=1 Tax=Dokdonella sp. TaxID=2291710 RepID=UPI0025B93422|nr:succinate dehydrogenase, cytochrome b556 subunit [Dokdonella sp.]MBX3700881.1 succinate dehydrogenase, cytochrome b556 subunit [Dokdonella sp.]
MSANARPLSPHIQIYRWQVQMVTSILHRATGIALAAGTLLLLAMLLALAAGPEAWSGLAAFARSWIGLLLLVGWSWALSYHLLNGVRHLLQDVGWGFAIAQFVRNGFLVSIGSVVLTALLWLCAWLKWGGA